MKNTMSIQMTSGNSVNVQKQSKLVTVLLWIVQVLLALQFLLSGSMKLFTPIETVIAMMPIAMPGLFWQFIGVAEVVGAFGLILPGLFRIQRRLTPLAACGLAIIMIGATISTVIGVNVASALLPLIVGLLCIVVAYGRRSWGRA